MKDRLEIILIMILSLLATSSSVYAMCGDVNGDGSILSNDVLMVARASIGTYTLTVEQRARADVVVSGTPDGQILSNDLLIIARASLSIVSPTCNEGSSSMTWAKNHGGIYDEIAYSIQQTADGGYIIAGNTDSFGAGANDVWVIKLDSSGNKTWDKAFGTESDETAFSIQQTTDGGYVVVGNKTSLDFFDAGVLMLRLDSNGDLLWEKVFDYSLNWDQAFSVKQTDDYGYIIAGNMNYGSPDHDADILIIKVDSSGNVEWNKTYGGDGEDSARSIYQTSDGGYIAAGYTSSYGAGSLDFYIIKIDSLGNQTWSKTFGTTNYDAAFSIKNTPDNGIVIVGSMNSDAGVLKIDSLGNQIWLKTFGGIDNDSASSIDVLPDGNIIIAGSTRSFGSGNYDFWMLKLDESGNLVWQKTYGGEESEWAHTVCATSDGGSAVTGESNSSYDFWVLKLDANGDCPGCL
jgi:hypothetical protein